MLKRIGWLVVVTSLALSFLWAIGYRPVQAVEKEETEDKIQQTLETILKNQGKMMQDLDWIKKELDVIRIRTR